MSTQLPRTLCKSERLHCHSACRLCLLLGESSPPEKRRSKLLLFLLFFSPNHSQLFKAPQLRLFSDYSFVLASAQKKEVPFQKRTNWMTMWQQVEDGLKPLRAKCLSYRAVFPAARKPVALTTVVWNKLIKIISASIYDIHQRLQQRHTAVGYVSQRDVRLTTVTLSLLTVK